MKFNTNANSNSSAGAAADSEQMLSVIPSAKMEQNPMLCAAFRPFLKSWKKKHWIETGIYYGYPKCCIVDFCVRGYKMTKEQEQVHKNIGFVPCPKCSKKNVRNKNKAEELRKVVSETIRRNAGRRGT